ncbi:tRNA(Met) cytidine acetyltransferase TmcA [Halomonas halocynthiae]|uniref:tRNA(Met) cytidine acetyltransferase TmcA n=1 Tax=Halomonas halocynthiae TaxID=176290 RepID=UPI0003FE11CC|nr:GNAT family N-acetyltransferase [Halomonas halocynthiae]
MSSIALKALRDTQQQLLLRRWRGLVWLTGDAQDCKHRACSLWLALSAEAPLWVSGSDDVPPEVASQMLPIRKARQLLGSEHDLIVLDAVSPGAGFDPDAFGALSGTLRAGGLLILMTPEHWGTAPDADYARLAAYPWQAESLSSHYLARLARLLGESSRVIRWSAGESPQIPEWPMTREPAVLPDDPDCLTQDQADVVARLEALRRRRPLVITADRGRGKSAALGIACARRLAAGDTEILITAPRSSAVEPLFARLAALYPHGDRCGLAFYVNAGAVRFIAPDALCERVARGEAGGLGQCLLVDEAAAIPAALLGQWLAAFPRMAFATTVHGYEGAGRGFALRFRQRLEQHTPNWQAMTLSQPIRWALNDPLEMLTSQLLMLDAEPASPSYGKLRRIELSAAELSHDEPRLRAFFGLLVQAHYRTTPSDLRRLLDAPDTRLVALEDDNGPQAVMIVADEGGFSPELAEHVARGERRLRGHLLAQSLAAHAGERDALTARLRRVLRIAVHPQRRREGLGHWLVEAERELAAQQGIALLGASFGAEPGLMAFWRNEGMSSVRLGLARETSTGEHAVMVLTATSTQGQLLEQRLVQRFHRQLPGLLAFELRELVPEIATQLLAEAPSVSGSSLWHDSDVQDLHDVALANRDAAMSRPAIQALLCHCMRAGLYTPALALLVGWAFQGRSDNWLATRLGLTGARQVDAWRRKQLTELLGCAELSTC